MFVVNLAVSAVKCLIVWIATDHLPKSAFPSVASMARTVQKKSFRMKRSFCKPDLRPRRVSQPSCSTMPEFTVSAASSISSLLISKTIPYFQTVP